MSLVSDIFHVFSASGSNYPYRTETYYNPDVGTRTVR